MVDRHIQEELMLLGAHEYRRAKERVFNFLDLFKKADSITIRANKPHHANTKVKSTVTKYKDVFIYQKWYLKGGKWVNGADSVDRLEFQVSDEDAEWHMQNLYCAYRESELRELLANSDKGHDVGQQLSLF